MRFQYTAGLVLVAQPVRNGHYLCPLDLRQTEAPAPGLEYTHPTLIRIRRVWVGTNPRDV